jgi:DNA helicase II / ATP-dependent DNA helicase PcrA
VDRLLDGLTEDQRRAVTVNVATLRILAGAGSGKTRVLTHRIAHQAHGGVLDPARTVALTFTRKAAGELRRRLRSLGLSEEVAAGTFHAQAYAQLRTRWRDQGVRPPELLDRRGRLLGRLIPTGLPRPDRVAIAAEIDWATAQRITPERYIEVADRAGRRPPVRVAQVAEIYGAFVTAKQRRRLVDFDDLLELCIRDSADPDRAAAQHWRVRHLFVDEFQDVNRLQFDLLRAWRGPASTLCIVGDPNQAIYGWNGADARYLTQIEQFYPDVETVQLRDNFRSTPQILAAAAALGGERARLVAHRRDGPPPTVTQCTDEHHEAETVARRIRDRRNPGSSWSSQAVLVRTNAQTAAIASALTRARIPFRVRDGAGLLEDPLVVRRLAEIERNRTPLRVAFEDLRLDAAVLAGTPADDDVDPAFEIDDALEDVPGRPERSGTDTVGRGGDAAGDGDRLSGSPQRAGAPSRAGGDGDPARGGRAGSHAAADSDAGATTDGPAAFGGASDRSGQGTADPAAALAALAALAEEQLVVDPEATGAGFVAWVRATLGGEAAGVGREGVEIATFHAAKGLEWRIVHLAGIEDGLVPIGRATTDAAREEERRLFYVALTRAHDEVHCTWAATRRFGNRTVERQASPMLAQMSMASIESGPDVSGPSNLERVRALRATLAEEAPPP